MTTFDHLSRKDLEALFAAARPVTKEIAQSKLGSFFGNIADAAVEELLSELEAPVIAMAGKP